MTMTDIYLISSDFEGTSVSLLEAMFNSKAIVASDVPGLQDMIENDKDGMLYDVKSPEQLRKCLIELMDSKSKAERLGKAARNRFKTCYDYSDVIGEYKSMLK
jgi:glycosyltransferase involved in cell wall biosynthesis